MPQVKANGYFLGTRLLREPFEWRDRNLFKDKRMFRSSIALAALALVGSTVGAGTAEARRCAYMTKTAGAVVGGVGGAVLGGILTHGSTGPLLGAAGGAVVGHEIARKNHRKCRYTRSYRRR